MVVAKLRQTRVHDGSVEAWIWLWCPGCDCAHAVPVEGPRGWTFNGNVEAPTLSPSLLVRSGQGQVCHSFVRNGRFEFLADCTHALAGKDVPLAPLPAFLLD